MSETETFKAARGPFKVSDDGIDIVDADGPIGTMDDQELAADTVLALNAFTASTASTAREAALREALEKIRAIAKRASEDTEATRSHFREAFAEIAIIAS